MNIEKAEASALMAKILREIAYMVEKSASIEGHVNQISQMSLSRHVAKGEKE